MDECRISVCRIGRIAFPELLGHSTAESLPQLMHGESYPGPLGNGENTVRDGVAGKGRSSVPRRERKDAIASSLQRLKRFSQGRVERDPLVFITFGENARQDDPVGSEVYPGKLVGLIPSQVPALGQPQPGIPSAEKVGPPELSPGLSPATSRTTRPELARFPFRHLDIRELRDRHYELLITRPCECRLQGDEVVPNRDACEADLPARSFPLPKLLHEKTNSPLSQRLRASLVSWSPQTRQRPP